LKHDAACAWSASITLSAHRSDEIVAALDRPSSELSSIRAQLLKKDVIVARLAAFLSSGCRSRRATSSATAARNRKRRHSPGRRKNACARARIDQPNLTQLVNQR